MRIFLGGHLSFYHPNKDKWLKVKLTGPAPLADLLCAAGVPLSEVQLVAVNGEVVKLKESLVSEGDQVKVFSPVGGGSPPTLIEPPQTNAGGKICSEPNLRESETPIEMRLNVPKIVYNNL